MIENSYIKYRARRWLEIDRAGWDRRGNTLHGKPLGPDDVIFEPKAALPFKDIWYCGSEGVAKRLVCEILQFPEPNLLTVQYRYVYVEYRHHGLEFKLLGQMVEDRGVYKAHS